MMVTDLNPGESALVESFSDEWTGLKLMHMGLFPGQELKLFHCAPSGDRLVIESSGIKIALRRNEASVIQITAIKKA